jgi:hypothetical protein
MMTGEPKEIERQCNNGKGKFCICRYGEDFRTLRSSCPNNFRKSDDNDPAAVGER